MAIYPVQAPTTYLAGSGVNIGDTTITVTSFVDIYGNTLTMADFGSKGQGCLEPDTNNEEAVTYTGITANANGTYTLTGVKTVLAKTPFTETSGLVRQHAGGTKFVISDTAGFWNTFANKNNTESITGKWTFDDAQRPTLDADTDSAVNTDLVTVGQLSRQAIAGAANASTTVKGIVELATQAEFDARTTTGGTGALLVNTPDTQRSTLYSDYVAEIGVVATLTIASPCVITYNAHGLAAGDTIQLTTTGALPTGLTASTTYYVIATGLTANTFQVSTTLGGSAVNTSGIQSGVHSLFRSNVYVINPTPVISAMTAGREISFRAINANTTTSPTIIINGLAPINIKKLNGSTNLAAGDIGAGQIFEGKSDGTNVQMTSPSAQTVNTTAGVYPSGDGSNLTNIRPLTATVEASTSTSGAIVTITHNLGVIPKYINVRTWVGVSGPNTNAVINGYVEFNTTTGAIIKQNSTTVYTNTNVQYSYSTSSCATTISAGGPTFNITCSSTTSSSFTLSVPAFSSGTIAFLIDAHA